MVLAALPLADAVALRYRGRGIETDDLVQVARTALVKAVHRYRPGAGRRVSPPTPPRRSPARSSGGSATRAGRCARRAASRSCAPGSSPRRSGCGTPWRATRATSELARGARRHRGRRRRGPQPARPATTPTSLDAPTAAGTSLADHLLVTPCHAGAIRGARRPAPVDREPRPTAQRLVLHLRFVEELTQSEIGERIGVSQMQVSRILRGVLDRLRADLRRRRRRRTAAVRRLSGPARATASGMRPGSRPRAVPSAHASVPPHRRGAPRPRRGRARRRLLLRPTPARDRHRLRRPQLVRRRPSSPDRDDPESDLPDNPLVPFLTGYVNEAGRVEHLADPVRAVDPEGLVHPRVRLHRWRRSGPSLGEATKVVRRHQPAVRGRRRPEPDAEVDAAIGRAFGDDAVRPRGARRSGPAASSCCATASSSASATPRASTPTTPQLGWSMGKSVDQPAPRPDGAPEADRASRTPGCARSGPTRARTISVDQLLRMTSGLTWDETYALGTPITQMLYAEPDMAGVRREPAARAPARQLPAVLERVDEHPVRGAHRPRRRPRRRPAPPAAVRARSG